MALLRRQREHGIRVAAAQAVARAPADGCTILLGGAGETAVIHHLYRDRMQYQPVRDLRPVQVVAKVPNVVMAHPGAPFSSTRQLVAQAKARPGAFSCSASGIGKPQHSAGEYLNHMAGITPWTSPVAAARRRLPTSPPAWCSSAATASPPASRGSRKAASAPSP